MAILSPGRPTFWNFIISIPYFVRRIHARGNVHGYRRRQEGKLVLFLNRVNWYLLKDIIFLFSHRDINTIYRLIGPLFTYISLSFD